MFYNNSFPVNIPYSEAGTEPAGICPVPGPAGIGPVPASYRMFTGILM